MDSNTIAQYGIEQVVTIESQQLVQILQIMASDISHYLTEYDQNVEGYIQQTHIEQKQLEFEQQLKHKNDEQWKEYYANYVANVNQSIRENKNSVIENLALRTLLKGYELINHIRFLFTGQTIQTNFTIQDRGEIYVVNSANFNLATVFSTYGATATSPLSLAYKITNDITEVRQILQTEGRKISGEPVYKKMMKTIKPEYLAWKKSLPGNENKQYFPVFNSKDAEIYDLFIQSGRASNSLNFERYKTLRASLGSANRTSWVQEGDIGLIQDKYFSSKSNLVNYAKIITIKTTLVQLLALLTPGKSMTEIKQGLQKMFIANNTQKDIGLGLDKITNRVRKEATSHLNSIFRNSSIKIF